METLFFIWQWIEHMAVAGFLSPGFHRIDQQMELMNQLVNSKFISLKDIINVANSEGRTALHIALAGNIDPNVVELLMTVPLIDLNVRDVDGLPPRDLLKKFLEKDHIRSKGMCISSSPGTSFRYPDADLFLYTGSDNESEFSCEQPSSRLSPCSSEPTSRRFDLASLTGTSESEYNSSSLKSVSGRFKFLFQWPRKEQIRKIDNNLDLNKLCRNMDDAPTPLRQKFSKISANNKRAVPIRGDFSSPSSRERFTASLMHGVIQATPPTSCFSSTRYSPSSRFLSSSSPTSVDKLKADQDNKQNVVRSSFFGGPLRSQMIDKQHRRVSSLNKSLMNQYLCFGAQDVAVEDSVNSTGANRSCRRLVF